MYKKYAERDLKEQKEYHHTRMKKMKKISNSQRIFTHDSTMEA
jgi:hypothetical protein